MFKKLRKFFIGSMRTQPTNRAVRLGLELLEDRITPVVDTWKGGAMGNAWGAAGNWLVPGARAGQFVAATAAPGVNDTAVFSGTAPGTSVDCNLGQNITVASLIVQNGYTGTLTIGTGLELNVIGRADLRNATQLTNPAVNIQFISNTSMLSLEGSTNLVNFNFTGLLSTVNGTVEFDGR